MTDWIAALLMMGIYLVFAFALGLAAGRGHNRFSVSEYAVGDRNFGTIVMWFLMGGTIFSAFAFLGGPGWAYSKGAAAFYILAYTAMGLLPWYLIGPKVARLGAERNYFTMGDLLKDRYQSTALCVIVGVVAVLAFIQYLTLQLKGMSYVFNVMTDGAIPYWAGALIAYGIVCIYVMTSGVRGAAWSDVLQGAMMFIIAWIVGLTLVFSLHGGPGAMFADIAQQKPDFLVIGQENSPMSATAYSTAILVSVIGFVMWPHLFTKSYVARERTIKKTVIAYPIFAIFLIPVLFIGFSAIGVVGSDAVDSADQILPYMITNELGVSGLVYGIIGAGALAAAMSSSDAITHGASVSLGRDVVQPLKPDISDQTLLWIMRAGVVVVGAAAYYLAVFGAQGIVQLLLGAYGSIVQFAPSVYGALFWQKARREGAIAGLIAGVVVNFWFQVVQGGDTPLGIDPGILGLVANLIVFVPLSLGLGGARYPDQAKSFVRA
ncbi:sodium:solute symporter [Rhodovibrio sodomensis]|uniref:Sodium:solute symporter n=1 Tax=Rhodovibrio sodomensis TaxID=1088 RepID=A0ABS1D7U2_9PROT|nr:sodium:solute symporter family protein [Rhodovibrio sodomensis]MBK1666493.1 sodium:solute symporter [Rhodovibrio sodomensis]